VFVTYDIKSGKNEENKKAKGKAIPLQALRGPGG
jgi:hypothetical protein